MERGTIPPRHIWDAKFPNSVMVKVNIDHKVTAPEPKCYVYEQVYEHIVHGAPLSDIFRRYVVSLSSALAPSGAITGRYEGTTTTTTEASIGTSNT
jgi:hypothetical protein